MATPAEARKRYAKPEAPPPVPERAAVGPLTMMISLNQQRMFVYDAQGYLTQSRVSTGSRGYDTPKGIYGILEKKKYHESNIYEGAPMPFMQRLLWSGIAMHAGVVPSHPASHGCVRLPHSFASKFFELTRVNNRVVVMPEVSAPVGFEHAKLFSALPPGESSSSGTASEQRKAELDDSGLSTVLGISSAHAALPGGPQRTLAMVATERNAVRARLSQMVDAAAAGKVRAAEDAKVSAAAVERTRVAARNVRLEADKLRRIAQKAQADLAAAERKLAQTQKALGGDLNKMRSDKLEALRKQEAGQRASIAALKLAAQSALKAADAAKGLIAARDAEAIAAVKNKKATAAAIKPANAREVVAIRKLADYNEETRRGYMPITILVSAKTGLLTAKQGFENVIEAPVRIDDSGEPLGNFLFTATNWRDSTQTGLTWTATRVIETGDAAVKRGKPSAPLPPTTDPAWAKSALDRIQIPQPALDRIAELVKPGSTLIISDYDMARSENGAGTELIVQMPEVVARISKSGQPVRRTASRRSSSYDYYDSGYGGSYYGYTSSKPKKKKQPSFFSW